MAVGIETFVIDQVEIGAFPRVISQPRIDAYRINGTVVRTNPTGDHAAHIRVLVQDLAAQAKDAKVFRWDSDNCVLLSGDRVGIIATPVDLRREINIDKPSTRVTYRLEEVGTPTLADALKSFA